MEKFIRNLSTIITSLLIYTIGAYTYLSLKGFEYRDGTFTLVQAAQAATPENFATIPSIATKLDDNLTLTLTNVETIGHAEAPLTMFEFSSLGCTHCAQFHLNILPQLEKDFIEQGKLKVIFINFPLDKKSMQGALLAECVPEKNRQNFLNMAFAKQREWMLSFASEKLLLSYALANGLSKTAAEECLKNDKLVQEILSDRQEAIEKLKMQGTPAFLVSGNNSNEIIYGVPKYDALKAYLEERLNK